MTIKECIDIVDDLKPNQYSTKVKVMWLSFIDEIIINDVLKTHKGYDGRYDEFTGYSENKLSVPLIVKSPYDRLYTAYLKMKIDAENGETARYNNSAELFNSYMMEYRKFYNKTHMPLSDAEKRAVTPVKNTSCGISEAMFENLKRELYYLLSEDFSKMTSPDKLYDIVTNYAQNNTELLKGKDGKDGTDGKDGYTPIKGIDYFDGEKGEQGIPGEKGADGNTPFFDVDITSTKNGNETTVTIETTTDAQGDGELNLETKIESFTVSDGINGKSISAWKAPSLHAKMTNYDLDIGDLYLVTETEFVDDDFSPTKGDIYLATATNKLVLQCNINGEQGEKGADGAATIVQTTGDSETAVMSQKAVTESVQTNKENINILCQMIKDENYTFISEGCVKYSDGTIAVSSGTKNTGFIYVRGYTSLFAKGMMDTPYATVAFYDADKNYLQELSVQGAQRNVETSVDLTSETYSNVYYVIVSTYGPSDFSSYYLRLKAKYDLESLDKNNPLNGKVISFNGDSICYGAGFKGGYGKIIAERNNMIYENIGVSEARIVETTGKHCISKTILNMRQDADYCIVEGGINDATNGATLGSITPYGTWEFDETTYYGAFEKMLQNMVTRFAGKKIGYIAVHRMAPTYSLHGGQTNNFYEASKKCCEKWGVPFCDLTSNVPPFSAFSSSSPEELQLLRTTYTLNGDGWHLNEDGYKKYYCDKIEAWLKTL